MWLWGQRPFLPVDSTQGSILENSQVLIGRAEEAWKVDKLWDHSGDEATSLLVELTMETEKECAVAQ